MNIIIVGAGSAGLLLGAILEGGIYSGEEVILLETPETVNQSDLRLESLVSLKIQLFNERLEGILDDVVALTGRVKECVSCETSQGLEYTNPFLWRRMVYEGLSRGPPNQKACNLQAFIYVAKKRFI